MNALSRITALAALGALTAPAFATAPLVGLPAHEALTGPPGCLHVIDLLHRYGGGHPLQGRVLQAGGVIPSPFGPFAMPASELGDLCVATIEEVPAADPGCAPTFVIGVTNNSTRAVCDLHVSLVALLGRIAPHCPTANACVAEIPAGATVEVEVTLPIESLSMGSNGGCVIGFQKLLVAIDSFDRMLELDEANNLRLLCRADIPKRVAAVVEETTEAVAPADAASPAAPADAPATPSLDSALEKFGLGGESAAEAAHRL